MLIAYGGCLLIASLSYHTISVPGGVSDLVGTLARSTSNSSMWHECIHILCQTG